MYWLLRWLGVLGSDMGGTQHQPYKSLPSLEWGFGGFYISASKVHSKTKVVRITLVLPRQCGTVNCVMYTEQIQYRLPLEVPICDLCCTYSAVDLLNSICPPAFVAASLLIISANQMPPAGRRSHDYGYILQLSPVEHNILEFCLGPGLAFH